LTMEEDRSQGERPEPIKAWESQGWSYLLGSQGSRKVPR
jgi:hypothetical protein